MNYLHTSFLFVVLGLGESLKKCDSDCINIKHCKPLLTLALSRNPVSIRKVQNEICERSRVLKVCCPKETTSKIKKTKETTTLKPLSGEDLLPKNCGNPYIDDRIVGGEVAPINAYPWMATLAYRDLRRRSIIKFQCSATVISSRYLLTAAHCVTNLGLRQLEGINIRDWNLTNPGLDYQMVARGVVNASGPHVEAEIEDLIVHPTYNKKIRFADDIALIRIGNELNFEKEHKHIIPICISKENFTIDSLPDGVEPIAAGWGITENGSSSDVLLRVKLPIANTSLCESNYRRIYTENQICAGGEEGKDTCAEDSGGPLIVPSENGPPFTQIGVLSFGHTDCGTKDAPAVYTSVAKYRDWIVENLKP